MIVMGIYIDLIIPPKHITLNRRNISNKKLNHCPKHVFANLNVKLKKKIKFN